MLLIFPVLEWILKAFFRRSTYRSNSSGALPSPATNSFHLKYFLQFWISRGYCFVMRNFPCRHICDFYNCTNFSRRRNKDSSVSLFLQLCLNQYQCLQNMTIVIFAIQCFLIFVSPFSNSYNYLGCGFMSSFLRKWISTCSVAPDYPFLCLFIPQEEEILLCIAIL